MERPEIVPFADEHVEGAAALLAERHGRHRAVEPTLPEIEDFAAQVEGERESGTGVVAIAGGEVVGYLLGPQREDSIGPHVWSYVAGHAVREPELVRDLYAAAAQRWVADGLTRHFVYVPALPELIEPWFRLSFGASAAVAARETAPVESVAQAGISVRPGTPEDTPVAAAFDRLLHVHLTESPSFSGLVVPDDQKYLDEWKTLPEEEQYTHFVAERDGRVVGHLLLYRRPAGDLRVPPDGIDLAHAVTEPSQRGEGAGLALTAHALRWAHEQGYPTMTTDWRMTNLLASRFWPKRGFRETFLRVYRSIP